MISVYQRETDGEHLTVAVRVHAVKNFPRRFFQHGQVLPVSEVCGQVVPLNHLLIAHPGVVMTPPRHRHKMRARALSLARSLALYPSFPLSLSLGKATSIHDARENQGKLKASSRRRVNLRAAAHGRGVRSRRQGSRHMQDQNGRAAGVSWSTIVSCKSQRSMTEMLIFVCLIDFRALT